MRTKQNGEKALIIVVVALAAVIVAALLIWMLAANVFVAGGMYPKKAEFLNLRGKQITLEEYDTIRKKLPKADIYWNIPFQGKAYPENTVALRVDKLSDEDVDAIGYFAQLEVIDARACTDYPQILALVERYPNVVVGYGIVIDGAGYAQDARQVTLTNISDQDLDRLQYLKNLEMVDAGACEDYAQVDALKARYPQLQVACNVKLGGEEFGSDSTEITVTGISDAEADALKYLPNLTKVTLKNPNMTPDKLFNLQQAYPNIAITWELEVLGATIPSDATEMNLMEAISPDGATAYAQAVNSNTQGNHDPRVMIFAKKGKYIIPDLSAKTAEMIAEVEAAIPYLPNVEKVNMCGAFLDNEAMAAFRNAHRDEYQVVWTVDCGDMVASTDTTYFMPYKFGVAYFHDEDTYNLRYCEDIVAIDLGHMSVKNVEFTAFMPNLKYLIIAHTRVQNLSGLENCKSLLFVEMDWSEVKDYTPLLGCTSLEDLNISKNGAPIDPILQMTWLKHLWAVDRGDATKVKLTQTFGETDTVLTLEAGSTVGGGWRELQNYYDMRDALGMDYMRG